MKERKVRVFISSTFKDLNVERNYLNTIIFPQIREYCEKRFIEFVPIDLRWGITEEASRTGLVLSACMEEVDNARPFFIGIIGDRYGWQPSAYDLNNLRGKIQQEREWLLSEIAQGASITEMEMEYGVLRNNDLPYAGFFIRNEQSPLSQPDFKETNSNAAEHLKRLKKRILSQSKYPVTTYSTKDELGEALKRQLIAMIEKEFPIHANEQEETLIQRQRSILEQRSRTLCDIHSTWDFFKEKLSGQTKVIVLNGVSGGGTSTQLAYCVKQAEALNKYQIIYYDAASHFSVTQKWQAFTDYMALPANQISKDKPCLIAIDNASDFQDKDVDKLIDWIRKQDSNVCVALAIEVDSYIDIALPTARLKEARFNIAYLTSSQKRELITRYMKTYGKELTPSQLNAFENLENVGTAELIFILRAIVNYGSFEKLDEYIEKLTKKSFSQDKFWIILRENDATFKGINKDLAEKYFYALTAISASRGIPESDIQAIFSISSAEWSVLHPNITQFCKSNANTLTLTNRGWDPNVGFEFWEDVSRRMIRWYLAHPETWIYAAPILASVYYYIIYPPFTSASLTTMFNDLRDGLNDIVDDYCSFAMSPDMMKRLDNQSFSKLWKRPPLLNRSMSESPKNYFGRKPSELSEYEAIEYYKRLAQTALGLSRTKDAHWCYMQLYQLLKTSKPSKAIVYQARAYLVIGQAQKAIQILEASGNIKETKWSLFSRPSKEDMLSYDQLRAMHVLLEAYFDSGRAKDVNRLLQAFKKHVAYCFNPWWTEDLGDYYSYKETLDSMAYIAYITSGILPKAKDLNLSKRMIAILDAYWTYITVADPIRYYVSMAFMIREYSNINKSYVSQQDKERIVGLGEWGIEFACLSYGRVSYQHARAQVLAAYVYYKVYGNYGRMARRLHDYVEVDKNGKPLNHTDEYFYDAEPYGRSLDTSAMQNINWAEVDHDVKQQLLREYDFYWNIEKALQPGWFEEKLITKRNTYLKQIGFWYGEVDA